MSGLLASAVVKVALDKLAAALGDRDRDAAVVTNTRRGKSVFDQLGETKHKMESISAAVLEAAERRWTREHRLRLWLERVEDVAYEIWDMVDEIRSNKDAAAPMASRMLPLSAVSTSRANKISSIRQQLNNICEEQVRYNLSQHFDEDRSYYFDESEVVGRDEQVQRILDLLLSPAAGSMSEGTAEYPIVLPIFGLAGVGKSTVAAAVYHHTAFQDYARAWVHVPTSFDLRRIGKSIKTQCLTNARSDDEEEDVLDDLDSIKRRIHELVVAGHGKKVLIVLDDIRDEDQQELDGLKSLLHDVGNQSAGSSSKVIVIATTRDEDVARRMCTNKVVQPYKLHPLSDDHCWQLLKRESLFEDRNDKQGLEKIGRDIATKYCGGLPHAAQQLGDMLRRRSYQQWSAIASTDDWNCDDLPINHVPEMMANFLLTMAPSCLSMAPTIRLCFAYLGTLPNRHNMAEDDIIHRWIALGLIDPSNNAISTGHKIISRLVDFSFLQQHSNLASTSRKHDDKGVISFTMHSLIHYFARCLMSTLLVADGKYTRNPWGGRCHYAVLTNLDLASSKLSGILRTELRSLSLLNCSKTELTNDSFSFAKYLQVLELREPSMQKLPDSICQLWLLGYLNLSGCSGIVQLPESFGNLTRVLHINLSGCSGLVRLPESFGNLTSVVHINLSGCHGLDDLPKSFCKLSNLEYLDLSCCSCPRELDTALGGLTNLRHVNLSHPSCYALEHKDHLEQLKDIWAKLTKLQYLNLSMFMNPIFCYLPEGESLDCFQSIFKGLSNLKHLDLSHNIFLVDLPETLGDLSKLHTLNLSGCRRLKIIPEKIAKMKCNRVLRKCPNLESYSFVVQADDGAYSSNLVQLEDIGSCKELEVSCLENVKSVEDAKRITLEKKRLEKLTLGWTEGCLVSSVDDEALLAELVPPQNLQQFALKGYKGKRLLAWLTLNLCLHLPNLEEVTLENIPKCHTLPPLLLLPKLKQVVIRKMASITKVDAGELSGGNRADLHRLVQFTLDDMENLQEFNTVYRSGGEDFMFPAIDELLILNCPNLKFGPFLPAAQRMQISACDQVMFSLPKREAAGQGKGVEASSSSTSAAAPRVTQLVVDNCKVPLGEWSLLYHLPGLHSLEIRGCNDLTRSQEIVQALPSLQSLRFFQCNGMASLPEYLGDLSFLQELTIDGCQDIESLPDNINKLSNLKDLRIPGCPKLEEWCKSAENKQKLAHIQIRDSTTLGPDTTANQTRNKQLTRGQSSLLVTLE